MPISPLLLSSFASQMGGAIGGSGGGGGLGSLLGGGGHSGHNMGGGGMGGGGIGGSKMNILQLLQFLGPIAQTGLGLSQLIGNKRPDFPFYEIPESQKEALAVSRELVRGGLPGADRLRENIGTSTAATVRAGQESGAGSGRSLALLGLANEQNTGALRDLTIAEAQADRQNQAQLIASLQNFGQLEQEQFAFNVKMPFEVNLQEFFSNRAAGGQNLVGGLTGIGNVGANISLNQQLLKLLGS